MQSKKLNTKANFINKNKHKKVLCNSKKLEIEQQEQQEFEQKIMQKTQKLANKNQEKVVNQAETIPECNLFFLTSEIKT